MNEWIAAESDRLLEWGARARDEVAFGYLSAGGQLDGDAGHQLLITARMTYVFALAAARGRDSAAALRDHGVAALLTRFWDGRYGGWVSRLEDLNGRKSGYDHAFVLLAGAAARNASPAGAHLFDLAQSVLLTRFWSAAEQAIADSFDVAWDSPERYRGANANMHLVEALVASWHATGDGLWLDRALSIATRIIDRAARAHGWRVPEHFDAHWRPTPEYNASKPTDQFRPFGYLVGHSFEWSRLLLQLERALIEARRAAPEWLREAALGLWQHGLTAGWAPDGQPGFVYSLDWDDRVVVDHRLHWVACEAAGAAAGLASVGADGATDWRVRVWQEIRSRFWDPAGSWHHELNASGRPSSTIWPGKPDVYHAYQATLLATEDFAATLV
jgi:sulfoquinovose isomerase